MKDSFTLLKLRLLLKALDLVPNSELHTLVIQQAHVASTHAQSTPFPELVLPCLFEELVSSALRMQEERERIYWRRIKVNAVAVESQSI
jgi:hypothetical protein